MNVPFKIKEVGANSKTQEFLVLNHIDDGIYLVVNLKDNTLHTKLLTDTEVTWEFCGFERTPIIAHIPR